VNVYARTEVTTPRGNPATVITREGSSDLSLVGAFFHLWGRIDDEYRLGDLRVEGVFVDIGAHIGLVTLAVLLDNPNATAICLEPLAENLDLMAENMDANGVASRVTMLQGGVGKGDTVEVTYGLPDDSAIYAERFIGGLQQAKPVATGLATVPAYTLAQLVEMAGGAIDTLKIDCEGCEWTALADPIAVGKVARIVGEWHGHPIGKRVRGVPTLRKMIGQTHTVEEIGGQGGIGNFVAVAR
jgi:FkbM family methyltransferase